MKNAWASCCNMKCTELKFCLAAKASSFNALEVTTVTYNRSKNSMVIDNNRRISEPHVGLSQCLLMKIYFLSFSFIDICFYKSFLQSLFAPVVLFRTFLYFPFKHLLFLSLFFILLYSIAIVHRGIVPLTKSVEV